VSIPRHVALIMDGNGRWAAQRGWPRIKGHKEGVRAVQDILDAASDLGIQHLTLYAFSTENWKRPAAEVAMLMALLRMYLRMFLPKLKARGIRFHHLGAAEGLPEGILKDLRNLETQTAAHPGMVFHLSVNYGSRLELAHAARQCLLDGLRPEEIEFYLNTAKSRFAVTLDAFYGKFKEVEGKTKLKTLILCRIPDCRFLLWHPRRTECAGMATEPHL